MIKIPHIFGHAFVESEELSEWGKVDGYGLDCQTDRNLANFIQKDLAKVDVRDLPKNKYFFGLLHPPCQRFSNATPEENRNSHVNLIPKARKIADRMCKYWVIENVPQAPLKDPVYLEGKMFGLPIRYKRGFESNYKIQQPELGTQFGYDMNVQEISVYDALDFKNYTYSYDSHTLIKNCLPRAYVSYLMEFCPVE